MIIITSHQWLIWAAAGDWYWGDWYLSCCRWLIWAAAAAAAWYASAAATLHVGESCDQRFLAARWCTQVPHWRIDSISLPCCSSITERALCEDWWIVAMTFIPINLWPVVRQWNRYLRTLKKDLSTRSVEFLLAYLVLNSLRQREVANRVCQFLSNT
jgi:hypothetical protein